MENFSHLETISQRDVSQIKSIADELEGLTLRAKEKYNNVGAVLDAIALGISPAKKSHSNTS